MADPTEISVRMKGPRGYTLRTWGVMRDVSGRVVRFGLAKSPMRTAAAFVLALALSLGLWALIAAGWLILH